VAVATLMALAVGVSTVGLAGMSDVGRLEAAAAQVGAVVRLASCAATRSGVPRVVQFDQRGCAVKKPVYRDGQWEWATSPRISLVSKVQITGVFTQGEDADAGRSGPPWAIADAGRSGPPWAIAIQPGVPHRCSVRFDLANGKRAIARIDGVTGVAQLELLPEDWD
jgi:hypothetical protein